MGNERIKNDRLDCFFMAESRPTLRHCEERSGVAPERSERGDPKGNSEPIQTSKGYFAPQTRHAALPRCARNDGVWGMGVLLQRWTRKFLPLLALTLLSACILVDDFGGAWTESKPDPCLSKIAAAIYFTEFQREPGNDIDAIAHGWSIGDKHFLLLKKNANDKGGRLYRFQVVEGQPSPIFQRLRLAPTMRATFEHDYPQAPVSLHHDTVTLDTLDAPQKKLLADIAAKPEYWEIEDQAMYNPIGNPTCLFDLRDLSHLPTPRTPK